MIVCLVIAFLSGALVPVQTAANSRLRSAVGFVYVSTLISFAVSTLSLVAVSLAIGAPLIPTAAQAEATPWWLWTGGIIALGTITANILLFKAIGQLQAMVFPVFGQLAFSLAIDHFGLFGSRVIPITSLRLLGMGVVVAGVFLIAVLPNMGRWKSGTAGGILVQTSWQTLGIVAGMLMASIGAIYARLGIALGSPLQATTVSFVIATTAIVLFCAATGNIRAVGGAFRRDRPWWMWMGGIIGAAAVFVNSWCIPVVGVGLFSVALLLGQMVESLGMEHNGWFGAPRKPIRAVHVLGIVLMLCGVALIRL